MDGLGATVAQLLDEWTKVGKQRGWTPYTEHRYRSYVDGRIRPVLGSMRLTKFSSAHCHRFYAALLEEGLSPTTVRHIHAIVASAGELAVDWGWLPVNPAKRAHPPSRSRPETRAPSAVEITKIVAAAQRLDPVKASLMTIAAMNRSPARGGVRPEVERRRLGTADLDDRPISYDHSGRHRRRNDQDEEGKNHLDGPVGDGAPPGPPGATHRAGGCRRSGARPWRLHLLRLPRRISAHQARLPHSIPRPADGQARDGLPVPRDPPLRGHLHGRLRRRHPHDRRPARPRRSVPHPPDLRPLARGRPTGKAPMPWRGCWDQRYPADGTAPAPGSSPWPFRAGEGLKGRGHSAAVLSRDLPIVPPGRSNPPHHR